MAWRGRALVVVKLGAPRSEAWRFGPSSLLTRLHDLVDRRRVGIGDIRLERVIRWTWGCTGQQGTATIGDLCGLIEAAARLALLKARRLTGIWDPPEEQAPAWLGAPPELSARRSWLAARIAAGPLSFTAPPRTYQGVAPALKPIAAEALRAAMLGVVGRQRPPVALALAPPPRTSVEQCSRLILEELARRSEMALWEVAGESRDVHVAAFLACLALARQGHVTLDQPQPFGPIVIRPLGAGLEATA